MVKITARAGPAFVVACLVFGIAASSHGFEAAVEVDRINLPDISGFQPIQLSDLPSLGDEVEAKATKTGKVNTSGLVSTINFESFSKRAPAAKEELIHLTAEETGFDGEITVRLFAQPGRAPLAVTLLGFDQACTEKLPRAWQTYLYDAGCHVLTFDSIIRNNMNSATGHGVAGNFVEEARIVAKLIDAAFDKKRKEGPKLKDCATTVRLLGTSYGGLLALQCLRQPQARTWPLDRVLVLATPLNMATAARRLDTFAREDKPFFSLLELMKLMDGFTPKNPQPSEKEEALMRAGIGYCFHGNLQKLAKSNICRYDPELVERLTSWDARPDQMQFEKEMLQNLSDRHSDELKALAKECEGRDKADFQRAREALKAKHKVQMNVAKRKASQVDEWNFQDYVFLLLKPYWKMKRGQTPPVTMQELLAGAPNFVQVFVSADDPLNDPEELAESRKTLQPPQMAVVPFGGHLGFGGTRWAEALVTRFFAADVKAVEMRRKENDER
jgi:predicted alpha/beta-fold hydrolase